jgi:hypothetical protein
MKSLLAVTVAVAAMGFAAPAVYAKGCLKGAAVGGVGGHVAGGHGVAGAAAGCLVGRHMANKKAKQQAPAQGVNEQSAASGK